MNSIAEYSNVLQMAACFGERAELEEVARFPEARYRNPNVVASDDYYGYLRAWKHLLLGDDVRAASEMVDAFAAGPDAEPRKDMEAFVALLRPDEQGFRSASAAAPVTASGIRRTLQTPGDHLLSDVDAVPLRDRSGMGRGGVALRSLEAAPQSSRLVKDLRTGKDASRDGNQQLVLPSALLRAQGRGRIVCARKVLPVAAMAEQVEESRRYRALQGAERLSGPVMSSSPQLTNPNSSIAVKLSGGRATHAIPQRHLHDLLRTGIVPPPQQHHAVGLVDRERPDQDGMRGAEECADGSDRHGEAHHRIGSVGRESPMPCP